MTPRSKRFWITNFILALIFISAVVFAWNNPPGNPPTGSGSIATDASNNVGVGEAAPAARLHVKTNAPVSGDPNKVSSSGATVTGTGAVSFLTQLKVGDSIIAAGQTRVVKTIDSATALTTNSSFSPVLPADISYTYQRAIASFNDDTGAQKLWVGATGQVGLGTIPGSATRLGISTSGYVWPLFITDGTRSGGIQFPSAISDAIFMGTFTAHRTNIIAGNDSKISVSSSGRVGINVNPDGGGAPGSAILAVERDVAAASISFPPAVSTILVLGSSDGTTLGSSIRAKGTASFELADLTEYVKVDGNHSHYEPGDILEISTVGADSFTRSQTSYSRRIAGVVSKTGSVILGGEGVEFDANGKPKNHVQLALAGRVPVKVIGPVEIGDAITSSDIPGVGMKAARSGRVVGFALESYSGEGVGYVKILINPHYWVAE